jgi:hypothetical protein
MDDLLTALTFSNIISALCQGFLKVRKNLACGGGDAGGGVDIFF